MIVILPFHRGDYVQASELLSWCRDLGGCPNHDALLLADAAVPWHVGHNLLRLAQIVFRKASLIATDRSYDEKWPAASNNMWLFAARRVKEPWLWLEPDATPLKPGWLDALDKAYQTCNRPFMGAVVTATLRGATFRYFNGVGIYPANAVDIIAPTMRDPGVAWDVAAADVIRTQAMSTSLIHCWWGEPDLPPSFDRVSTKPHVKTLDWLPPNAVLFHRNKDGSLIRLLRERLTATNLIVVLPYCNKDSAAMLTNLQWMEKLHGRVNYDALLCHPSDIMRPQATLILQVAARVFRKVETLSYRGSSTSSWPQGANLAWQAAAAKMSMGKSAWAWIEPDAVPLTKDWIYRLAIEYNRRGKPFMGPIVKGRGHCNGVAIYPPDTVRRCPSAMRARQYAWDWQMRPEMIADCHDASDLICHAWGEVDGKIHPFEGEAPRFHSVEDVLRLVPEGAVLFHRNKDGSLAKYLYESLHTHRQLSPRPAVAQTLPA